MFSAIIRVPHHPQPLTRCREQRAAGYAPADLAQLCRQGTAAAAKAQRVQQAAEETCLALHLRALTKRDPWLTAVGYVVDVAPGALIVTVPAYGVTAEVAYTDRFAPVRGICKVHLRGRKYKYGVFGSQCRRFSQKLCEHF